MTIIFRLINNSFKISRLQSGSLTMVKTAIFPQLIDKPTNTL